MNTILTALLAWALLGNVACNSSSQTDTAHALAERTAPVADKSSCLISYQTRLDQLLPLAQIQQLYPGDMTKAKKKYNYRPEAKRHDTDTYEYVWPSNRKRTLNVMGRAIETDVSNRIGLTWVGNDMFMMARKGSPVENFRFYYRNMTAQEKEDAFRKAGEVMEKKGYDKKQTQTAVGMGKEFASDEIMFKPVEGVGDAATWRIKEKSLIVLWGNTTFHVLADISENDDENIALARKLAANVLTRCN